MCHFSRLWNGMFDCHREEITVMQFTGHSLPVHQSVTVPWDFNPVPYCQPSSLTPMEYALPPSLEWHVWRGRRSIYRNITPFEIFTSVSISDSKSLQVSWTLFSILIDLNNALVWMVSAPPPIYNSNALTKSLGHTKCINCN